MAVDYGAQWTPDSLEQAQAWIDTTRKDAPEFWTEGARIASEVMDDAPDDAQVVVEYGCGVGRIIGKVDALYPVGVDASPHMVAFAEKKFPLVDFRVGDGRSYPIEDAAADFVYSILVLQHMDAKDAANVVKDTHRILRPTGKTWLQFSAFGQPWTFDAEIPRGVPMHGTLCYTREIVEQLAIDAGFKKFEIRERDEGQRDLILVATA